MLEEDSRSRALSLMEMEERFRWASIGGRVPSSLHERELKVEIEAERRAMSERRATLESNAERT